jgi:hypothetical protein
LDRLKGGQRSVSTIDDYAQLWNAFTYGGLSYTGGFTGVTGLTQTLGAQTTELAPNNFIGLSTYAYQSNGPVFRVHDGPPVGVFVDSVSVAADP